MTKVDSFLFHILWPFFKIVPQIGLKFISTGQKVVQKWVKNDPKMGYFDLFLAIFGPLFEHLFSSVLNMVIFYAPVDAFLAKS